MKLIHQSDREKWLEARKGFVTASNAAVVLGKSKYKTREQLLMEYAGLAYPDFDPSSESTHIGLAMESATMDLARNLWGWPLEDDGWLTPDPAGSPLAATPDCIMHTPWGSAVVNLKVTTAQAMEDCKPLKNGQPSTARFAQGCPIDYALQLQCEMACTGMQWAAILAIHCNVGFKMRAYPVRRNDIVIAMLRREAVRFMEDLAKLKDQAGV
jgi:predicted phage-related endonuclease